MSNPTTLSTFCVKFNVDILNLFLAHGSLGRKEAADIAAFSSDLNKGVRVVNRIRNIEFHDKVSFR